LANGITFLIVYYQLFEERRKRRDGVDKIKNLKIHLDDIERERLLDLKTGVPNEKSLRMTLRSYRKMDLQNPKLS